MKWLLDLLRRPSSFRDDPLGYARNQFGHGYIVGGGLTILGMPLWLIVIGYAIWETIQWGFYDATVDDAFEDLGHVALVAAAFHLMAPELLLVQACFVAAGYFWRKQSG